MTAGDWFGGRHSRPRGDADGGEHLDEEHAAAAADDQPRDVSGSRPTQALPTVTRSEGLPVDDPGSVRAVAKRVPSALPALGRDELSDAPPSARATADRRRQAREVAAEPAEPLAAEAPRPQQPEAERVRRVPGASLMADPPDGDIELVPLGRRSHEAPPPAAEPTPEPPRAAGPERPSGRQTETPPPAPTPPPPPPPVRAEPETAAPKMIDERPPLPYAGARAQTDEWVAVPPIAAPRPPAAPADVRPGADEPPRPSNRAQGPGTMPADTWETSLLPPVAEPYQGRRRRLRTGSRLSRAGWIVVLGVVLALSAAVAVPFLLSGGASDETAGPASPTGHTPTATSVSPNTGLPVIGIPGVTETPTPTPTPTPSPTVSTTTPAATSAVPEPPPFQTLTLEAENMPGATQYQFAYCPNTTGVLLGRNSHGRDVQSLNVVGFTAPNQAIYHITVYFGVVSGQDDVRLTVDGKNYDWNNQSGCGRSQSNDLSLDAGPHSIQVSHEGSRSESVLIDKIVIERR